MRPLTPRESTALRYISRYVDRHGYAPALRDVSLGAGLNSTSSAAYVLDSLEGKGYISREPRISRSIVVLSRPCEAKPCPECVQGKHGNCDGSTWCTTHDGIEPCPCFAAGHEVSS